MKIILYVTKSIVLLTIIAWINFGCRKDKSDPSPNDINSCRIVRQVGLGYYQYDKFGRLERDFGYKYKYDADGYLVERILTDSQSLNDKENEFITKYEYKNVKLSKTSYFDSFANSLTIQLFEYDEFNNLSKIIKNIYTGSSLILYSTITYEFDKSKIISYIELTKNILRQPYTFEDGKVAKYNFSGGYNSYTYDDLGRILQINSNFNNGNRSIKTISYEKGKSYFTTIPKFKGFPVAINNWQQSLFIIPENDLIGVEYLHKNIAYFNIKNGIEIEQSRISFSYEFNSRDLPEIIHFYTFDLNNEGVLTQYDTIADVTLKYENCE